MEEGLSTSDIIILAVMIIAFLLAFTMAYSLSDNVKNKISKAEQVCDKLNMEFTDEPRNVPKYYCINKTSAVEIIYAEGRWRIVR